MNHNRPRKFSEDYMESQPLSQKQNSLELSFSSETKLNDKKQELAEMNEVSLLEMAILKCTYYAKKLGIDIWTQIEELGIEYKNNKSRSIHSQVKICLKLPIEFSSGPLIKLTTINETIEEQGYMTTIVQDTKI